MMAMKVSSNEKRARWMLIAVLAGIAFFGSYAFAQAKGASTAVPGTPGTAGTAVAARGTGAGGCCGSGAAAGGSTTASPQAGTGSGIAGAAGSSSGAAVGGGGGCCGAGVSAPPTALSPKDATIAGGVQKITIDVSKGYYDPSNIVLKAGVPAEITFSQSSGCTAVVQSNALGFSEDLSSGPKTVKVGALQPGTYGFACGMNMVAGSITVK